MDCMCILLPNKGDYGLTVKGLNPEQLFEADRYSALVAHSEI